MNKQNSKKTIKTFALASFLNDFGSDMIFPIWPLFVTAVLNAPLTILGLIDGLSDAIVSLSQATSGYFSDRLKKRKIFIWLGYFFGAIAKIGYAFSKTWQHLVPLRIIERSGKMRDPPRDAIVAEVSTRHNRGRNFGVLRAFDNFGALCGIIFTTLFFAALGYRNIFFIASAFSLSAALLIIFAIREPKKPTTKLYKGVTLKDIDANFRLLMILSAIFALGTFSYSFLLVYANAFGIAASLIPLLYLIFTAMAFLFSIPFGKLADRIGRKPVLAISFILWGLVCSLFIAVQSAWSILLGFVLFGLHRGALEPVQKTFVAELAPKKFKASGIGGFQMVIGLVALPASLMAGFLWDKINILMPFYVSLGLTALSLVLLIFVKEN
jgi:MFS family permease